jgi:hypothetical protein
MKARCEHDVLFWAPCAACEAIEDALDPTPIGKLEEVWFRLADALDARGKYDDHERAGSMRANAPQHAIDIYSAHARDWYARHGRETDLGGEA